MRAIAVAGCLLSFAGISLAADEIEMIDGLQRVQAIQKDLGSGADDEVSRGVYWKAAVWPPTYQQLRVCFFGGTPEARRIIARFASGCSAIKLDFGDPQDLRSCNPDGKTETQIRIAFDGQGWWSALGQDSVVQFPQDQRSMNLARFGNLTEDTWSDGHVARIRHEFGHALGLLNEHQSPNAPCEDEFDWPRVYKVLGGPPNYWSEWVVDVNMRKIEGENVVAKEFDRLSVMHYYFPVEFYKKGLLSECFIERTNLEISQGDHALLAHLYPVNATERRENFVRTKAEFAALWNKAGDEASKGIGMDVFKTYFERSVLTAD
jgi:hypothetical protein